MGTLFVLLILGGCGYAAYRIYRKQRESKEQAGQTAIVAGGQNSAVQYEPPKTKKRIFAKQIREENIKEQWVNIIAQANGKGENECVHGL